MKPAVFLDRDGVLTKENYDITLPCFLELFSFSKACIDKIHEMGFLAIVVTNQSGVARGRFTEEELIKANSWIVESTGVDDVFYCPHHTEGIISKYVTNCCCRKPKTGMIRKAVEKYDIDITKSFMVGDRSSDILTGRKAGMKTALVESGYGLEFLDKGIEPDYYCKDLKEFVQRILVSVM